ncbi:glycosyltransferase family 2 protein [Cellulosilyticum ruminicola]|uniref:glycosyltransferase family 2 protein n=1 Tax=Cellulosilyticum ruminicola TaxID=425254 RepID=UPI0006D2AFD0|nr:glycosyltransferase family 2 protein [Cellulosilyticum ruminicola]
MQKLTVIIPCYNEESSIPHFYKALCEVMSQLEFLIFEILFIDDGSQDYTLETIKSLQDINPYVHYISFSRNFGKESAIYAGLKYATGDLIVIMDADLQHPPQLLVQMYETLCHANCDSVAARRVTRIGEPPIRSFLARCFYAIMHKLCKIEIVDGACDFRLMTRQMVDALLELTEYNRFSKGLFSWVGFRTQWIEFENVKRIAGETHWSFWGLVRYSLEGLIAFSTVPLALASIMGLLFCAFSFIAIIFTIIRQLIWGASAYGWPSLVCIICFISGIQLFCIGILGQYLAKTYLETKHRPLFIVKENK